MHSFSVRALCHVPTTQMASLLVANSRVLHTLYNHCACDHYLTD